VANVQKVTYESRRTGKALTAWRARFTGPDGRERSKRFDRKVDADDWVTAQRADVRRGTWIDPDAGTVTLAAYANQWLEDRRDLRTTTQAKYRDMLDRQILPALGSTPLSQLKPTQVRTWWSELHSKFPSTAANAYRLLSTICNAAVNEERIGRSPCRVKGGGAERAAERPTITVAELGAAIESIPERFRLAPLLAAWCQLRRGEALGIQRQDVDLLHGTISVRRSLTMRCDGVPILGEPKTEAGRRTLSVPSNVLSILEEHIERFVAVDREAWLFPSTDNREKFHGLPASPRTIEREWAKARKVAGRPDIRFHDLRHSGATWLAGTGASTAELMLRLGHASAAASLRYQHATADRDRVLADALADLASGKVLRFTRPKFGRNGSSKSDKSEDVRSDLPIEWQPQRISVSTG